MKTKISTGIMLSIIILTIAFCTKKDDSKPVPVVVQNQHQLGFAPATAAQTASINTATPIFGGDLPSVFILDMPPAGYQGALNSCTSWSSSYATETFYMNTADKTFYQTSANLCCPNYVYNQLVQGGCISTSFPDNLNLLISQGVCSQSDMPYVDNNCTTQPNATQIEKASHNKISKYELINKNDIGQLKTRLYSGFPIMIGINVDENFDNIGPPNYLWSAVGTNIRGGHAVTVTGYDDTKSAFKVINSWGTGWGDNGYLWISYSIFPNVVIGSECYIAYPIF